MWNSLDTRHRNGLPFQSKPLQEPLVSSAPTSTAVFCSSHSRAREGSRSPWNAFKQILSNSTATWPTPRRLRPSPCPLSSLAGSSWLPDPIQSVSLPPRGLSGLFGSSDVDYSMDSDTESTADDSVSVSSDATTPTTNTTATPPVSDPHDLDSPRAQIDSGAKVTVTNILLLL